MNGLESGNPFMCTFDTFIGIVWRHVSEWRRQHDACDDVSPSVSVVVPLYNGKAWVGGALASLQHQTFQDFEAVIVNDGSTDRSFEVVKPFLEDRRFRYIAKAHEGVPQTRNSAVSVAHGDYIAFLDQDDLYQPTKLEAQRAFLEVNSWAGIVHTAVERIDGNGQSLGRRPPPLRTEGHLFNLFLEVGVAVPLISVMVRRNVWEAAGPFDESFFGTDDLDWLLRVASKTEFGFLPEPLVLQRFRTGTAGQSEPMYVDRFVLVEKLRRQWPNSTASIDRLEQRARYLYGSFLLASGRSKEARDQLAQAWKLKRADWKAAAKWTLATLHVR